MFRTFPLSIIRSFFTVHTTMLYVIQIASGMRMELQYHPHPARKLLASRTGRFTEPGNEFWNPQCSRLARPHGQCGRTGEHFS